MLTSNNGHTLEVQNLSCLSTVCGESWYNRLYSPPVVAQILKDVNFEAHSGEIHGIVGVSGSGKSILLNALAGEHDGQLSGRITLDRLALTKRRFQKFCAYTNFRYRYPEFLTVSRLLYFLGRISLSNTITNKELHQRVGLLMKHFEIDHYANVKISNLSNSGKRRVLTAAALVKDPVILTLDDALVELEPLAAFQLTTCLLDYAKRFNRIILLSLRNPRSDLNQFLARITILFYGEVAYSGSTKNLPVYFNEIGFPSPMNENPAVYYLSLLTVDRESGERFQETQEQAIQLLEKFREHTNNKRLNSPPTQQNSSRTNVNSVALCSFQLPDNSFKIKTLLERSIYLLASPIFQISVRVFGLTFVALCLAIICPNFLSGSWTIPYTSAGILKIYLFLVPLVQSLLTFMQYSPTISLMYIESHYHLYNPILAFFAHLGYCVPFDILSIFLSTAMLYWSASLSYISIYLRMCFVFGTMLFMAEFVAMSIAIFIRKNYARFFVFSLMQLFLLVQGSGMLRQLSTVSPNLSYTLSYLNPYRYAYYLLISDISGRLPIKGCKRNEKAVIDNASMAEFCRWEDSASFRRELVGIDFEPADYPTNAVFLSCILFSVFIITLILHYAKKPKVIVDKFRFRKHIR